MMRSLYHLFVLVGMLHGIFAGVAYFVGDDWHFLAFGCIAFFLMAIMEQQEP